MVNAFRAGTIVAVVAGADRLVHGAAPPDLRRPHAGRRRRSPARPARSWLGVSAHVGLLRVLPRRRAGHRRVPRADAAAASARSPRSSARCRRSRSPAASCSSRSTAASSTASTRCCSAASSASPTTRSLALLVVGAVALAVLAVDRPAAAVRVDRPRRRRRPRRARPRAVGRCSSSLLGVAAAEASQITGALLVFALLVVPAATAQPLTARPRARPRAQRRDRPRASPGSGSRVAYFSPYPIGFCITTLAFGAYLAA